MLNRLLLILAIIYLVESKNVDLHPAIAMVCGKNTQHKDVSTGEWITDSTGKKDCMKDLIEVLQYCRQVYPSLHITNIERQSTPVRIRAWCAIGNPGPKCRGHVHSVNPVKCITEDHTPTLVARTGCNILSISNSSQCMDDAYWTARASEKCQEDGTVLDDKHNNILPCDINRWYGTQFACCKTSKPVPKLMNVDPICTLPRESGMCRAAFDSWYFNVDSGSCTRFTYGGCGGNQNRFQSLKACQDKCETNALIKDPLLHMELGPVIPKDSPLPTSTSSAEQTTTTTQSASDVQSSDSYFNAPLDPRSEPERFSHALMNELKEHKNKLSSLMNQWSSAKDDLIRQGASSEKDAAVDSDLQKEMATLHNEHERKREQIMSVHQARVDAGIVGARTSAYNDLNDELNKPDIECGESQGYLNSNLEIFSARKVFSSNKPSKVVRAFHHYIRSESHDQHHTNRLLQKADQNSDEADALNSRLDTIKTRVNNALATVRQRLGPGDASNRLNDMVSKILPTSAGSTAETPTTISDVLHDDVIDYDGQPLEDERPRLIDYGGLPPENVDNREEIDYDDDDDEPFDHPIDHCASSPCVNAYSCWNRINTYTCLCNEGFTGRNCETATGVEPGFDSNYEENEDYISQETPAPLNPLDFTMPDMDDYDDPSNNDIDPLANMQWEVDKYNEQNWLIWVGVGGSCLLLLVLLVAGARAMGSRYNHRRQFARVEVEEQLTPEERQLLQMQQNGYENPTYKFFEKQQQQQQQQQQQA